MRYDNPYWEYHLPINPPGAHLDEDFDVILDKVEVANWLKNGRYIFQPRLRDSVQTVRRRGLSAAIDD